MKKWSSLISQKGKGSVILMVRNGNQSLIMKISSIVLIFILSSAFISKEDLKRTGFFRADPGSTDAPNNFDDALEIFPSVDYNGTIGDGDEFDFYKVSIVDGDKVRVHIDKKTNPIDRLKLNLYSGSKIVLYFPLTYTGEMELERTFNYQGFVVFSLNCSASASPISYDFKVTVTHQDDASLGIDAGDSFANSNQIDPSGKISGFLGDEDKIDAYKLALSKLTLVNISIDFTGVSQFTVKLYDSEGILRKHQDINNESSFYYVFDQPFFVLSLEIISGHQVNYSFNASREEQNDGNSGQDAGGELAEAIQIETNQTYSGVLGNFDTKDFYKISLDYSCTVLLIIDPYPDVQDLKWQISWFYENGQIANTTTYQGDGQPFNYSFSFDSERNGTQLFLLLQIDSISIAAARYTLLIITTITPSTEPTTNGSENSNWLVYVVIPIIIVGSLFIAGAIVAFAQKYKKKQQEEEQAKNK